MKPTAIVVDDDPEVLEMTASLLDLQGLKVVAKDQAGEQALEHLRKFRPKLAVMDIHVPGGGGLDLLDTIRRERLPTRTILVTGYPREIWLVKALELEAEGFLLKPHVPELVAAVAAILGGEKFFCSWATRFVMADYVRLRAEKTTTGLLTARELDVLKGRVQGKSVKEIAAEIAISPKTVEKHVTKLRRKIGSTTPLALAAYAGKLGIHL